jgi:anion-transporting  ArsA/GET3 family ATPase
MDKASETLFALKPVTFRYKADIDPAQVQQYGLIAEEVAKLNPDLVVSDPDGQPATLRFLSIQAMLLNEFLKEHRKNEEQEATITKLKSSAAKQEAAVAQQQKNFEATAARQQGEIKALTASLKEQAAQIQKVSAQLTTYRSTPLALREPASQTVFNDQ